MPQFVPVLTSRSYTTLRKPKSAMAAEGSEKYAPLGELSPQTLEAAQRLALDLPGFEWTIEVDILGRHRITIHFKGATIDVDD